MFKSTLIDLGFGREATTEDNVEGEIFFFEGQLHRIVNLDETDGSLDNTTDNKGGRPPVVFCNPDLPNGAVAANKSGYSSTVICGSNAAGEALPPHFQLRTLSQSDATQKISVDWFIHAVDVVGKFGFCQRASCATYGQDPYTLLHERLSADSARSQTMQRHWDDLKSIAQQAHYFDILYYT